MTLPCPSVASVVTDNPTGCIRLRGVRQNNLKGFDLDLPLGRLIVVTGLSGTGKSSLVFDTMHAEGQRRYVETFSAYTRQFLELLDKPRVDAIENIRPSIAIAQTNTVKTSRSTVGTMTELTDFFKVWFGHVAECFDPATGEKVEDDNPRTIWLKAEPALAGAPAVVAFRVQRPANLKWAEILPSIKAQGYVRVLIPAGREGCLAARIDHLLGDPRAAHTLRTTPALFVVQDRLAMDPDNRARFLEATETALHFGHGEVFVFREAPDGRLTEAGHYSRGLHSPGTGRTFRPATPALFSFNSPLGACPLCRGFGRVIDIDYRLAIPDRSLTLAAGAIKPWEGKIYGESKRDLFVFARKRKIPTNVPFADLTPEQQDFVINGEPDYGQPGRKWPHAWYGLKGFFRYFETKTYKMHVRVFLSRYRAYNTFPACGGARLQPEALCWRWRGRTLPQLYALPVADLLAQIDDPEIARPAPRPADHSADLAHDSIVTRLQYLQQVGLGYLTLDRASRTLSGGEVERVNLTSCLGTSLVDTLFVLDEPSVGLHPRDINRLIGILRSLTEAGNTVVVVEHDEAMIRAADQVIEIGPEPGGRGGYVTFQGPVEALLCAPDSFTGAYLSGRLRVEPPAGRRPVGEAPGTPWLEFRRATKHNVVDLTFRLPLQRLVCLSGVSGSGKSTLLDNVIHQGLLAGRHQPTEDPAAIEAIHADLPLSEIVLVDQSPASRTPRSNPALYTEAWDAIRELYAAKPAAQAAGFHAGSFSFNSGDGRCEHCQGLGYERVEMQFLSDVFVPCAVCAGRRFKPEVLAIAWNGQSIADLLETSVADAVPRFAGHDGIQRRLAALEEVGLGYLTLGQPLNTLSGGEAQRLKLVRYLGALDRGSSESRVPSSEPRAFAASDPEPSGALLLLDEPTTGLHAHDVKRLLEVLHRLVDRGHSVVVIEHNLDVLKSADWILEVGPDAGNQGGRIVAAGTPEELARADTATSPYLRRALAACHLIDDNSVPPGMTAASAFHAPGSGLMAAESPASSHAQPAAAVPMGRGVLEIVGARENNLQNLSVSIPHHELSVVTGVSGSGKSTLAFDIVFAEGQRRFMESMSPYARQFVEQLPRPAVDRLTGIPPTVAIEQRVTRGSHKSTVATITEVAQYLRLLYARIGIQHHPETDHPVNPLSPDALRRLLARALRSAPARRSAHAYLCAPLVRGRKGHHQPIATWLARQGYALMRVDGRLVRVADFQKLDRYKEHDIEVVVADLKSAVSSRLTGGRKREQDGGMTADLRLLTTAEALGQALQLGKGSCFLLLADGTVRSWFSTTRTDSQTGESFPELDPKHFSFNSPKGWCPTCRGHGRIYDWMLEPDEDEELPPEIADLARRPDADGGASGSTLCPACHGARLNRVARAVKLHFRRGAPLSLPVLLQSAPDALAAHLGRLALDPRGRAIAREIVPPIVDRLKFLDHVGLGYLSLDRPTETLSGGEAQRIRLAAQLGSNLSGVLYVLDEPTIGLHARDNERLIDTLLSLRDKGNSLLVVEHDDAIMERADRIIDLGPGAGTHGGQLVANGSPAELKRNPSSLTGLFLTKGISHPLRGSYRDIADSQGPVSRKPKTKNPELKTQAWLSLAGARFRNLHGVNLRLPHGALIMVCGPSGAGKSSLFSDLLAPAAACAVRRKQARLTGRDFARLTHFEAGAAGPPFAELRGASSFRSIIEVDQNPIGKTPRSTPATYLGIFDLIRQFFASLPESRIRGYTA